MILAGIPIVAAWLAAAGPALAQAPVGPGYALDADISYADPFPVTELRTYWIEAPGSAEPDCSCDDENLYLGASGYDSHRLDVYYPLTDSPGPRPVVLFLGARGWDHGYRGWFTRLPELFTARRGWVTVVADVRLVSDKSFPAATCPDWDSCRGPAAPDGWEKVLDADSGQWSYTENSKAAWYPDNVNDAAEALAWVLQNIADPPWLGDPDSIFLLGHLSGAHLAALLALHPGLNGAGPVDGIGPKDFRGRIRGVAGISGVYDLASLDSATFGAELDMLIKGYGHDFPDEAAAPDEPAIPEALLDAASPVKLLAGAAESGSWPPPFLLVYAQEELPGLEAQATEFAAALARAGGRAETRAMAGYGHEALLASLGYASGQEPQTFSLCDGSGQSLWPDGCLAPMGPWPRSTSFASPSDQMADWIEANQRRSLAGIIALLLL